MNARSKMRPTLLLSALCLGASSWSGSADTLAEWEFALSGWPRPHGYQTCWFGEGPGGFPPNPSRDPTLFEDLSFTNADAGKTFYRDAASDPDFDTIVQLLTNGQPDFLGNLVNDLSSRGGSEAYIFAPLPAHSNGVDFAEFSISSISLHVTEADLDGWNYTFEGRIGVQGQRAVVPELPATSLIAGLMLVGGALLRRWRRSRPTEG